ncbi:DEAD/DEAH box helicase family protein [Vibrio cyclitrophicus]|uniref:DEAD/DEAH box helicase family protein n=1 Tax=Vibrio cyclitrophicus TaxID=47951 RepID=UPI000C851CC5|nr:DEAD/DEAH box helicase family protein [Vibrio cyclitrophicus]PMI03878.1 hypothetical protein BCU52_06660 [Vibrio cyclitrophicus]
MKELTFNRLMHHSFDEYFQSFKAVYNQLFDTVNLDDRQKNQILAIVVLFSNQEDLLLKKWAYRMALTYGLKTNDFQPLYDISINTGLMPVVALLKQIDGLPFGVESEHRFLSNLMDSYIDNFRVSKIVHTEQQVALNSFFNQHSQDSATIVAPTSYGKSELIMSAIESAKNKNICVLVPSKSLLAQTRKRILDAKIDWVTRIISHPEMCNEMSEPSVYVLTQERLTRLLNQYKTLVFDLVIVDEAHNILDKDGRNVLLASAIKILEYRNSETAFKFLTPFLQDPSSLNFKNSRRESVNYKVTEYVKSECFYIADYRLKNPEKVLYDQFTDDFTQCINECSTPIDYLKSNALKKNIIYFNRPKHIQIFARELAESLPLVYSDELEEAIEEIKASTHEDYLLLYCLKRGVLYHHGSMSDSMRNYAEHLYRSCCEIRYLVSSSTLLEGVNLPIERMFLFDVRKGLGGLRPSQFKNLIGRVNRFSEVFSESSLDSLHKLQPQIHIVGTDRFLRKGANLQKFIKGVMYVKKVEKDLIENPFLDGAEINDSNKDEYQRLLTRLENIETGISDTENVPLVKTAVGLKLLEHNISDIDVFKYENEIDRALDNCLTEYGLISDSNTLLLVIYEVFIAFIQKDSPHKTNNLTRLESDKAQTFYAMFLDWNIANTPLGVMIGRFIKYWRGLPQHTPVFTGSWGDTTKGESHREVFTYISRKSKAEQINLAIVRIKEEEDFFDYVIFRFVEILHELEMIDSQFYKLAKYGTTDKKTILMIQNGFSRGVAELIRSEYADFFEIEGEGRMLVNPLIHRQLIDDNVGFLQRYEIGLNVAKA